LWHPTLPPSQHTQNLSQETILYAALSFAEENGFTRRSKAGSCSEKDLIRNTGSSRLGRASPGVFQLPQRKPFRDLIVGVCRHTVFIKYWLKV
jgi:hypothetical protein